MTTENMTIPERLATLEEAYRHLATREDLANMAAQLNARIDRNAAELKVLIEQSQLNTLRWTIGTLIALTALAVAAIKLL